MRLFLLATVLAAAPPERSAPPALPPADWSSLPPLTLQRPTATTPEMTTFVRDEVVRGRCNAATRDPYGWTLGVDIAVLAGADGRVRRVVPRAIQCPTVEQYAAGLVWSAARDNIGPAADDGAHWYRTHLTFNWKS